MSQDVDRAADPFTTVAPAAARPGFATVYHETRGADTPHDTITTASHAAGAASLVPGYEILRELGRGGMGVVYLARQLRPARLVALKMILAGAHARADEVARFRREIEAVAAVEHANLVPVYEVGEHQGRPYYAMQFVAGGTLAGAIAGQPQPPRAAAAVMAALAHAMQAIHRRGIIHRDLKPANILMATRDDQAAPGEARGAALDLRSATPKIADFGLAKTLDDDGAATVSGTVLGTPSYMAPEQAAGLTRDVGPHTDVYALGAILYELLIGRPPFQAEMPWDTIHQVMTEEPVAPRRLRPDVPVDLETICLKCLRKEPARRYRTAEALAEDLTRFLDGEPVQARPIGWRERGLKWARRRPAMAALLIVCCLSLVVLTAGALLHFSQVHAALAQAHTEAEESRRRLVRLHVAQGARLLDVGDSLAALPWFAEALHLSEGRPDEEESHRIRIAVALRHRPRLLQLWYPGTPLRHAVFAGDGSRVITATQDGTVQARDTATGVAIGPAWSHGSPLSALAVSPDGRRVVTCGADGTTQVWDAHTGARGAVLSPGAAPIYVSFRPDGQTVVTASSDGAVQAWDAVTGRQAGMAWQPGPGTRVLAFDGQGMHVLAGHENTARVWDLGTGMAVTPPLPHAAAVVRGAFAPDGRRIATAGANGVTRLWSVPAGQSTGVVLRQRGGIRALAFSPNGRRIVTAGEDNTARIWTVATGEALTPPLRHNGSMLGASFHPNGGRLLTVANDHVARLWDLSEARIAALPVLAPTIADAVGPQRWLSPDGRWEVTCEGDATVRLRDVATRQTLGPPLMHGSAVLYAAFSPDGRRLVTLSDDNTARIWATATGKLQVPPLEHAATVQFATFSPHGRWLATVAADQTARVWDTRTGAPLTPPLFQPQGVRSATFTADGHKLDLVAIDGSARAYELEPDPRSVADLLDLAQLLAGHRVDGDRGLLPLRPDALCRAWGRLRIRFPHDFAPHPSTGSAMPR